MKRGPLSLPNRPTHMSLRPLLLSLLLLLSGCASGSTADLVLQNGTVVTLDDDRGTVEALAHGVTSFQDQGASFRTIELYREMARNGTLGIRMYAMVSQSEVTPKTQDSLASLRTVGAADQHLTVRSIGEVTADGALGSRSAWMLKPYDDAPNDTGINVTPMDRIREIAEIGLEEDEKGTLSPGKLADVAVLSHNLLEIPADRIRETTVDYTIVGGTVAYERE